MGDDIAIKVENLSKTFKLPHERSGSVKNALINFVRHKRGYETQHVLKNVSFEVKKGEFFGIVGRNGSGKSTLLKLLAGIYTPTKGAIQVNGKLTPFIELGVGFNPELTGRENVFLNGSLLGFNRKEMQAMYHDIVEFAELERFMDQKLKNYSSGMQVRLAFSIAIRANTDILVLDEVLAVGDAAFQQKCNDYFEKLKKEERTIILVTHDMSSVEKYCDRAMLIHDGDIAIDGSPKEVANQYIVENYNPDRAANRSNENLTEAVESLDAKPISPVRLTNKDVFEFEAQYKLNEDIPIYLGFSVMYQGVSLMEHNSRSIKLAHTKNKIHKVTYRMPLEMFHTANFEIDVAIFKDNGQLIGFKTSACEFFVDCEEEYKGGPMLAMGTWSQL